MGDFKYTPDHDWVSLEGDVATLGITNFAKEALGDIVFLELPTVGAKIVNGDAVGVIESIKSVIDLYTPFDGEVIEVNEVATNDPSICNKESNIWLFKVKVTNVEFWNKLMNKEDYQIFCNK